MTMAYVLIAVFLIVAVEVNALKTIGERKLLPPDLLNCFLDCPGDRLPGSCDCADANPVVPKLGAGLCRFTHCPLGTNCVEAGFSALCLENRAQALTDICSLPPLPGLCPTIRWDVEARYYFNPDTGQCELFAYGGCGGNENNFRSLYSCRQRCVGRESMFIYPDSKTTIWF